MTTHMYVINFRGEVRVKADNISQAEELAHEKLNNGEYDGYIFDHNDITDFGEI